ncbi:MAG: FAD-binding protein [Micromonospora sp.]
MIGLRPGTREWSTAPGPGVVAVPELVGELSTRESDLVRASDDFGHQVYRRPLAVLHPGGAADIAATVRFGRQCGLAVVPRGGGNSVDGQAQARDGIVVDLAALAAVHEVGPNRVTVDAGARWSAVVEATLPYGLAPPVLPDYLELTVGGTISVGGISGASHRHGCVADTVLDLEVVTPDGELVTCSPSLRADLFDAVRGGQGRHGIITRATVALAPAHRTARRYQLAYDDLRAYLADQVLLIEQRRFDHVGGQARFVPGTGWRFLLEAVTTYTSDEPDDRALLAGLAHDCEAEEIHTSGYADFLYRAAPAEARLRALGSWQRDPHPRCTFLLPGRHAATFVAAVLAGLTADDLGPGGGTLLYPVPTERLRAPRMPRADDPVSVVFALLRTAPADEPDTLHRMRQANLVLHDAVNRLGGAGYGHPAADHHDRERPMSAGQLVP